MNVTDFEIKTVYTREDIEGFYDAFLLGRKSVRVSKKISKIVTTIVATIFWGFAALVLIANIFAGNLQVLIGALPLTMIFALLGLWIFSIGNRGFKSKASWKAYPYKGEQIIFQFSSNEFIVTQQHTETKVSYAGIMRLYEDSQRLYLFTTPQIAHILPKRDFEEKVDTFR